VTRRELAAWLTLFAVIATAVATGIVVGLLVFRLLAPEPISASRPSPQPASTERVSPLPSVVAARTEVPTITRPSPTVAGTDRRITPSPSPQRTRPSATVKPRSRTTPAGHSIAGLATWYSAPAGQAAAGPDLRAALGSGWRGRLVRVNGIAVRLTDWCACGDRGGVPTLIDLPASDFGRIAPLSRGVVRIVVAW
jgi:hypothetical protein